MYISSQIKNKVKITTKVVSNGALWGHYFKQFKLQNSEAMNVVLLNQLKFLNVNRVNYYKQQGIIK